MSLIAELKRRNVFRVGVAYVICAWVIAQVADLVLDNIEAPDWVMQAIMLILAIGLPLALILAWAFELTPEGIKREAEVDRAESITHVTGRKLDFAIIGLLALAVVFMFVDNYILEAEPEQAEVVAEQVPAAEVVERERSIAVLPFANISPDPDDAYFADGIHDEVLAQISKIRDLKVISRTSVIGYGEGNRPPLPEIAAALGVANILEGSVRLAGNQVRITTQLIEARSDAHLWTETYDRELTATNIFSIQSDVAKTVADELQATLSPEEQDRLVAVSTENLAAYEAYLLGKQRMAKSSSVAVEEAIVYFEKAVELDPGFALAYVGLAKAYVNNVYFLGLPPNEMYTKAEDLIERALELDDQLGEAYAVLGWIQGERKNYEDAEVKYRRALELNPNSAFTYSKYAGVIQELGQFKEALTLYKKAVELDPLSAGMFLQVGHSLVALGRFDEGLAWHEKALDVDPALSIVHWTLAIHYWLTSGEYEEAIRWFRKAISSDPGDPFHPAHLGRLFMDLGDSEKAEYWVHRSIETRSDSLGSNNAMLLLHLYQRDEAAGLEYGRKSLTITQSFFFQIDAVELLADHEVRAGHYSEARDLYAERYPELLNEDFPKIGNRNYRAAIDLALILSNTGEQQRADRLLEDSLQYIQRIPRLGYYFGYGIADVRIYSLQDEKQKALSALRQAIDEGWRSLWWYYLKYDPTLESLHDEPEFQAMIAEIEADMAAQLARVHEMERNGELEPIPGVPAAAQ
jgi:TolB-like protein/Flp pilus assembly protein TadD